LTIKYSKSQDILEVIIRDSTGRKICKYKANVNDRKRVAMIFQTMEAKHGIDIPREKEIFEF